MSERPLTLYELNKSTLTSKLPYSSIYFHVWWKSLLQVRTCLIEMETPNFLKIVDLW